ncbi:hypothetical protein EYC80_003337 [Monilinia laxa]|nr:hypothetical protein EYC80_003337 [Monilinia laxa]
MAWPKVLFDMNAQAPKHLAGGDLFEIDPWPIRRYTILSIKRVYRPRHSVSRPPIVGVDTGPREGGVDLQRMRVGFVLNDEQPKPEAIVPENKNPQPQPQPQLQDPRPRPRLRGHPYGLQLPSLRQVLNSPNDYPQPIIDRNTRVVQLRLPPADGRNSLPDAPARPAPDT